MEVKIGTITQSKSPLTLLNIRYSKNKLNTLVMITDYNISTCLASKTNRCCQCDRMSGIFKS